MGQEAIVVRNDAGSGQSGSSGDGEKQSDSGNILKESQQNLPTAWIQIEREKDMNWNCPSF